VSRQANGQYLQPANTAAVSGQTISSTAFNTLISDIGTEITNSLDRGGRSAMTAPLPMGGQKITGLADPTVATDGANKNYVDNNTFSTGDLKPTLKTVADPGWIMGGSSSTVGNTGSGATYANPNALALYTLIWNNISSPSANAYCPVTGGLGASAAADWAGLKKLETGWYSGRALGFAGGGGVLTTRTLGQNTGAENATLGAGNIPTITATNASQVITVTASRNIPSTLGPISTIPTVSSGSGFAPLSGSGGQDWATINSILGSKGTGHVHLTEGYFRIQSASLTGPRSCGCDRLGQGREGPQHAQGLRNGFLSVQGLLRREGR
jgi:hypothetical protein